MLASLESCKKYLDAKPDATLATPTSLQDLQGLLDYYRGLNSSFPGGVGILSDNFYLTQSSWAAISTQYQRNYYIWQKDQNDQADWNNPYSNIYTCNLVLESLKNIMWPPKDNIWSQNIKGAALFFRASYHYSIAQLFAKAYNKQTAATDLGIPLRLNTDLSTKATRSTVEQTYEQIITDLKESVKLLPLNTTFKTRPTIAAAYGALARTYLSMQDYGNAYKYADSCLNNYNVLIDYNTLDSTAAAPFTRFNDEVIFQAITNAVQPNNPNICKIDSNLYESYNDNDLRKVIYFKRNTDGSYRFKGDYDGTSNNGSGHSFTGIVTDEQYLIMAESAARLGKTEEALNALNLLLEKRMRAGTFIPVSSSDSTDLLSMILQERRKELLFRGTRWTDLKRLNQDPKYAITLSRQLNGQVYQLPAGETFVAWIPQRTIDMSGMKQNP
jgi:hypothetical protein